MYLYCFITSIIFLNIWLNLIDIIETTYYIQKTFLFFFISTAIYQYYFICIFFHKQPVLSWLIFYGGLININHH